MWRWKGGQDIEGGSGVGGDGNAEHNNIYITSRYTIDSSFCSLIYSS